MFPSVEQLVNFALSGPGLLAFLVGIFAGLWWRERRKCKRLDRALTVALKQSALLQPAPEPKPLSAVAELYALLSPLSIIIVELQRLMKNPTEKSLLWTTIQAPFNGLLGGLDLAVRENAAGERAKYVRQRACAQIHLWLPPLRQWIDALIADKRIDMRTALRAAGWRETLEYIEGNLPWNAEESAKWMVETFPSTIVNDPKAFEFATPAPEKADADAPPTAPSGPILSGSVDEVIVETPFGVNPRGEFDEEVN